RRPPAGDPGHLLRLRRGAGGRRPQPVRAPEHGPLPAAPHRRRHRPHPHRPAPGVRAAARAHAGPPRPTRGVGFPHQSDGLTRLGVACRRRWAGGRRRTRHDTWRIPPISVVEIGRRRHVADVPVAGTVVLVLAVLFPGQGSQKPGFLQPWLAAAPGAESRLRWWSVLAGVDLLHLGTAADADEIRDTARTQPLLVAGGLLAAEALARTLGGGSEALHDVTVVAGHSVGELGAAALAGALTFDTAIALAGLRGREMAAACARERTGMAAGLGGDQTEVLAAVAAHDLHPANRNGAGQIVAAGAVDRLEKFASQPPARARIIPLQVAGA